MCLLISMPLPTGTQYWSPSLLDFRLKPDWEAAAPLFEKAALAYKVSTQSLTFQSAKYLSSMSNKSMHDPDTACYCLQQAGQLEKARAAYEQAAQSQEKIGSPWHAAKHLETCSNISKDLGQLDKVADFSRQAGALYASAGRMAAGALAYLLCAVQRGRGLLELSLQYAHTEGHMSPARHPTLCSRQACSGAAAQRQQ